MKSHDHLDVILLCIERSNILFQFYMPHFIIECSANLVNDQTAVKLMSTVYDSAVASEMFATNDVKVRLMPFQYFKLGDKKESFIHVFGYIMEGRTASQKAILAKSLTQSLLNLMINASFVSVNISEFALGSYSNKALLDPDNENNDRHFRL